MTSSTCQICGRQLTDSESIARGTGPECAAKRATFVAVCGTTDAEIATLEASSEQAAKWIRNFRTDMRAGRVRQGRQCIEIARTKAAQEATVMAPVAEVLTVEPFIVVRQIERGGYYAYTPFSLVGFVDAFKRVVGGSWHPEKEAWYVPASQLTWTIEALEYWFGLPVKVERSEKAAAMIAQPRYQRQLASAIQ